MSKQPVIKKILCPIDFSEYSKQTLSEALVITEKLEAELLVLHVVNERLFHDLERMTGRAKVFNGTVDQIINAAEDDRAERLAALLGEVNAGRTPHTSRITVGIPYEKILDIAQEQEVDLIVMGARGRGSLARQLRFGTSAEKVFRQAKSRVLFIR